MCRIFKERRRKKKVLEAPILTYFLRCYRLSVSAYLRMSLTLRYTDKTLRYLKRTTCDVYFANSKQFYTFILQYFAQNQKCFILQSSQTSWKKYIRKAPSLGLNFYFTLNLNFFLEH